MIWAPADDRTMVDTTTGSLPSLSSAFPSDQHPGQKDLLRDQLSLDNTAMPHARDVTPAGSRKRWRFGGRSLRNDGGSDSRRQELIPYNKPRGKLRTIGGECPAVRGSENVRDVDVDDETDCVFGDEISCDSGNLVALTSCDTCQMETESRDGIDVERDESVRNGDSERVGNRKRDVEGNTIGVWGSVDRISGSDGNTCASKLKIGGSVEKKECVNGRLGGSLRQIGGSDGKIGGIDEKIGCNSRRVGGSLRKIGGSDGELESCEWLLVRRDGGTNCPTPGCEHCAEESIGSGHPARTDTPAGAGVKFSVDDFTIPVRSAKRNKSLGSEFEGQIKNTSPQQPAGAGKLSRALSFSTTSTKMKSAPAEGSRLRRLIARWSLPKSNSVFSSFGSFLASYFRPSWRSSDPTPVNAEENEVVEKPCERDERKMKLKDDVSKDLVGGSEEVSTDTHAEVDETSGHDRDGRTDEDVEGERPGEEGFSNIGKISETDSEGFDSKKKCDSQAYDEQNEVFLDADDCGCEEEPEKENEDGDSEDGEEEEFQREHGWVRKRVSQIERQITIRQVQQQWKELMKKTNDAATILSGKGEGGVESKEKLSTHLASRVEGDDRREHSRENSADKDSCDDLRYDGEEKNAVMKTESSTEDSDTEVEEDEEQGTVALRSKSRGRTPSVYRYSNRPTSLYRYSVVRPRTVIIGLG